MKSHTVKKGPVIILDVNLLFWLLSQNTVVPFPQGQETHSKALNEEFHCTSPNVLGEEVTQVLLFASLGWGQLPRHLLEYYLYRLVLLFEMSRLTSDSPLAGGTQRESQKLYSPSQSQYIYITRSLKRFLTAWCRWKLCLGITRKYVPPDLAPSS